GGCVAVEVSPHRATASPELGVEVGGGAQPLGQPLHADLLVAAPLDQLLDPSVGRVHPLLLLVTPRRPRRSGRPARPRAPSTTRRPGRPSAAARPAGTRPGAAASRAARGP